MAEGQVRPGASPAPSTTGTAPAQAPTQPNWSNIPVNAPAGATAMLHAEGATVFAYNRQSGSGGFQDLATLRGMRTMMDRDPQARLALPGHQNWGQALTGDDAKVHLDKMITQREGQLRDSMAPRTPPRMDLQPAPSQHVMPPPPR